MKTAALPLDLRKTSGFPGSGPVLGPSPSAEAQPSRWVKVRFGQRVNRRKDKPFRKSGGGAAGAFDDDDLIWTSGGRQGNFGAPFLRQGRLRARRERKASR